MEDDDDVLQLPADTLQALQDFQTERDEREKEFQALKAKAEDVFVNGDDKLTMDLFSEDWNASQFWYTDDTARTLARQLLKDPEPDSAIAVISAPSVYVAIRRLIAEDHIDPAPKLCLLEYDKRFEVLGPDFVYYDFRKPLRLSSSLKGKFDRLICDPPFLSEDCQTKTALTVRYLAKTWTHGEQSDGTLRFLSCTGERMEPTISKLYSRLGVRTTTFEPKHSKGLSNEFRCYANFECDAWSWHEG